MKRLYNEDGMMLDFNHPALPVDSAQYNYELMMSETSPISFSSERGSGLEYEPIPSISSPATMNNEPFQAYGDEFGIANSQEEWDESHRRFQETQVAWRNRERRMKMNEDEKRDSFKDLYGISRLSSGLENLSSAFNRLTSGEDTFGWRI